MNKAGPNMEKNTTTVTRWRSIWIANIVAFIAAIQNSALVPTVWPYLKRVDVSASENLYGGIRSLFALGQTVFSILSGYLSNKLEDTRPALIVGKALVIVAVVFYCLIGIIPAAYVAMFAAFEVVFGIASGCSSVFRTHIAMSSTDVDRVKAYGITALCSSIGLIVGPVLQIALSQIAYPGLQIFPGFYLNMFTVPAWLAGAISIIGIVMLVFFFDGKMNILRPAEATTAVESSKTTEFQEIEMHDNVDFVTQTAVESDSDSEPETPQQIPYNYYGIVVLIYANIVAELVMLNMSTIMPPYMMTAFQWSSEKAVVIQSVMMAVMGVLMILTSSSFAFFKLGRLISERFAIGSGITCYFVYHLITYPWGFYGDSIEYMHVRGEMGYRNLSLALNDSDLQSLLHSPNLSTSGIEIVGCNLEYKWCESTPKINFPFFAVCSMFTIGIATPVTTINIDTLYSKVLGPIKQGTLQGIFVSSSQVINVVGPVLFSLLYTSFGPKVLWLIEMIASGIGLISIVVFYPKLVSWEGKKSNSREGLTPVSHYWGKLKKWISNKLF